MLTLLTITFLITSANIVAGAVLATILQNIQEGLDSKLILLKSTELLVMVLLLQLVNSGSGFKPKFLADNLCKTDTMGNIEQI